MNNRFYHFVTENGKFVFDGNSVSLFEEDDDFCQNQFSQVPLQPVNSHRSDFLRTVCLVLNNSCNLCCDYCFANKGVYDKPKAQMSFENAAKAVDLLAQSLHDNQSDQMTLAFFGGEPLLSFNLIVKIIDYVEKTYPKLTPKYLITTNGTLITSQIAAYMEEHDFDIMVSIDGNKELHDRYRKYRNGKGSYDKVVTAIKHFKEKSRLNARITITDSNPELHSYLDDLLALGFERITFAIDYGLSKEALSKYLSSLQTLAQKYLQDIRGGKLYDITNFSRVFASLVLHNRYRAHCNAGVSYLTLSADGKYYRCPRFVGKSAFCVGNNDEPKTALSATKEFLKTLKNSAIERNNDCADCSFVYLCGGMCFHHAVISQNNQFANVSIECMQRKLIFSESMKLICSLQIEDRRKLLLYLTTLWKNNNLKEVRAYV